MPESAKSEVVVITRASAGVGRATVRASARRGADIGLVARGQAGLEGARGDVERAGGKALVVPTDVADAEQVEAADTAVEDELGPIEIWVNNAMTSVFTPFKAVTAEEYRWVTDVTYLGVVYGTISALRRMLPRDQGMIVQVGSALAYRGIPLQSAYRGAKHAIKASQSLFVRSFSTIGPLAEIGAGLAILASAGWQGSVGDNGPRASQ